MFISLASLAVIATLATSAVSSFAISPAGAVADDPVLEPEQLAAVLAEPGVRVLDARKVEDFAKGHVRGAIPLDLTAWNEVARTGRKPDPEALAAQFGKLGIGNDTRVVIYDGGPMTGAAAAWFLLQHLGADRPRVVNGGLKAIQAAATDLITTEGTPPPEAATFRPRPDRSLVGFAEKGDMKRHADTSDARIWDTRSADEYAGVDARENPRPGHMPTAIHLNHSAMLKDGRLVDAGAIRGLLESRGFKPGDRIAVHCQGGGRSSLAALAATRAGFGPLENYYMSFGEWAADESCPVVKP